MEGTIQSADNIIICFCKPSFVIKVQSYRKNSIKNIKKVIIIVIIHVKCQ